MLCCTISCHLAAAVSLKSVLRVVAVVAKMKMRDSFHPAADSAAADAPSSGSVGTADHHSRNNIHAVKSGIAVSSCETTTTMTRQPKSE